MMDAVRSFMMMIGWGTMQRSKARNKSNYQRKETKERKRDDKRDEQF
jgi:hypothetical protein